MRMAWRIALLLLVGFALTGCVTSKKYRMTKANDVRPAELLSWTSDQKLAEVTLQSVIVFKGSGSWKREARWDEYVISVTNHGSAPLVIEEVLLFDLLGQPLVSGLDPWELEKLSYTNWDKYGKTGLKLLAGAGAVAVYGAAASASALGSFLAGGAATASSTAVLNIVPMVAVVNITAVAIVNKQNRNKVAAEFNRRRLEWPLNVAENQTVTGSLFFPMTPGPQTLFLRGKHGRQPTELAIDLKLLSGLHLKPEPQ